MLSKKHDPFISLEKEVKEIKAEAPQEIQYPSLYLNEIDIGLTDKDLDQTIIAEVKIKPKRITKTIENGKTHYTCELDVLGIRLKE